MEIVVAVLSVLEALIGLISIVIEKQYVSGQAGGSQAISSSSYQRLVISCVLVYAVTGMGTAVLGGFATFFPETNVFWASTHTCWIVGYLTIITMILYRVKQSQK